MLNIEDNTTPAPAFFALFELGFRPFFTAAGIFGAVSMLLWTLMYGFAIQLPLSGLAPIFWHAHEMIFGYAMAVIAGFLMTAVANWTGIAGYRGAKLVAVFALWLLARVAWFLPFEFSLQLAAIADLLFMLSVIMAVALPVIKTRQWTQLVILLLLCLMLAANSLFYAGTLSYLAPGIQWGIYSGLYLILLLLFVMAQRVLPFFIQRGVEEEFSPAARRWVEISSILLFLAWALLDIYTLQSTAVAWLSLSLFVLHSSRLFDWYTPGIWSKPLLWSVYLGYGFLALGFLFKALAIWQGLSPFYALHLFAVGGLGLISLGMMSRVVLGHTGRDVFSPPKILTLLFLLMILATLLRVVLPLLVPSHYALWIMLSQLLWISAFTVFSIQFIPQLMQPRIDGRRG